MSTENKEAHYLSWIQLQNIRYGNEIIQRLTHFLIINGNKAIVEPILGKAVVITTAALRLSNFIFMMWENQITAATVEVKGFP